MNKQTIKNYIIMMIGGMVIGIGVAFVVYGKLGGDSMTTFEEGLSNSFKISLPIAQIIANGIFAIILFFIKKSSVNIDTILCPLFISLGCKLAIMLLPAVSSIVLRVIYMVVGIIIVGAGIGIGAQTPSGSNPYDGTIIALSEKVGKSYSVLRPVCDAALLVVGILLKGSWGIGTIAATFCTGFIANFFIKLFKSLSK